MCGLFGGKQQSKWEEGNETTEKEGQGRDLVRKKDGRGSYEKIMGKRGLRKKGRMTGRKEGKKGSTRRRNVGNKIRVRKRRKKTEDTW